MTPEPGNTEVLSQLSSSRSLDQVSETIFQAKLDRDIWIGDVSVTIRALSNSSQPASLSQRHSQLSESDDHSRHDPGLRALHVRDSGTEAALERRPVKWRQEENIYRIQGTPEKPRQSSTLSRTTNLPGSGALDVSMTRSSGTRSASPCDNVHDEDMSIASPYVPSSPTAAVDERSDHSRGRGNRKPQQKNGLEGSTSSNSVLEQEPLLDATARRNLNKVHENEIYPFKFHHIGPGHRDDGGQKILPQIAVEQAFHIGHAQNMGKSQRNFRRAARAM